MKLTPWYPPHIKPVREGWYECVGPGGGYLVRMRWVKSSWWYTSSFFGKSGKVLVAPRWRGLEEEPKK